MYRLLFILPFLVFACGKTDKGESPMKVMKSGPYSVVPLTDSPEFANAELRLDKEGIVVDGNSVHFNFHVENYELGAQTESINAEKLANSGKGQHIHLILNNGPYSAHYEPHAVKELEPGNYTMLAFLSRSYHESVKARRAFIIDQFTVGDVEPEVIDFSKPHLFFSRPKGTYVGKDIENLLLDFFLVGIREFEGKYYMDAEINGVPFKLEKWVPYVIQGLEPGEVEIKLTLRDMEGNVIDSPYNPVSRTVMLQEETS